MLNLNHILFLLVSICILFCVCKQHEDPVINLGVNQ